jgi:hypothetical protein
MTMALGACKAGVDPAPSAASSLAGRYEVSGTKPSGGAFKGEALIAPRGDGYDVFWYFPDGTENRGFGVQVEDVFGAVLSPNANYLRGIGVIAYKIAGGELTGVRLSGANPDGGTGREVLKGSPDLIGRYEIASSENPYGATLQSGHVEIERRGETYSVVWYTPERSYVGSGLRLGDVLVVGYGRWWAPGMVAHCIGNGILTGNWLARDEFRPGQETLRRAGTSGDRSGACN